MKVYLTKLLLVIAIVAPGHMIAKGCLDIDFDTSMEFIAGVDNYEEKLERTSRKEAIRMMDFLRNLYNSNKRSPLPEKTGARIPKIFHQIWVGPLKPPAIFKKSQESIKKYHPDWEYKLWTDADIEDFKLFNKKYYEKSKNYGERSDIFRYEILYRYGGVYVDVDFVCLKPFDILHDSFEFYTSVMPLDCADMLANGVIGSVPGHPILEECIVSLKDDWKKYTAIEKSPGRRMFMRAGPFHFQESFFEATKKNSYGCIALPKSYFFPINYSDRGKLTEKMISQLIKPEAFAIHYWQHSWSKAKVKKEHQE